MLISVIIPVYNVEKYLRQCLDSVIGQTYNNIEIILVDDGSTDNSGLICDEYKKKYKNIKVIHKKNEGLGFARNSGLEVATGIYVTFLDSDDYLDNKFVEVMVKQLENNNMVDVVKSGFIKVHDDGKVSFIRKYENLKFIENDIKQSFLPRLIGSLPNKKDNIEMCVTGSLYKMSYITDNKIIFPSERVLISEDLIFNIDYMQYAQSVIICSYVGYYYRYNPSSLTMKYRKDRFESVKYFYLEVKKKINTFNCNSEVMLRLSKMFFIYIRMCICQEKKQISRKTKMEILNKIDAICKDKLVCDVINAYPLNQLGFKQKVFIYLIKYKCKMIIYFLLQLGLV